MAWVQAGKGVRLAVLVGLVLILGILAWAWADGGREPLRQIAVPVALPGGSL